VPLVKHYRAPAAPIARRYTALDIALLVEMDKAAEDVCGPAIIHLLNELFMTKKICAISACPNCHLLTCITCATARVIRRFE